MYNANTYYINRITVKKYIVVLILEMSEERTHKI